MAGIRDVLLKQLRIYYVSVMDRVDLHLDFAAKRKVHIDHLLIALSSIMTIALLRLNVLAHDTARAIRSKMFHGTVGTL